LQPVTAALEVGDALCDVLHSKEQEQLLGRFLGAPKMGGKNLIA
jgi:hypothetical protein